MRFPRTRLLLPVLVLACGLVASSSVPASAQSSPERAMATHINRARAYYDLRTLRVSDALSAHARKHSQRMASAGRLFHNSRLPWDLRHWDWVELKENVGRGGSAYRIYRGFMGSSSHRANILNRRMWQMGVGVVYARGQYWVTVIFYR